ncbi:MAG: FlgD immunoglobulin-like domain containing protein [candidate division KSB1 bacterium]|nr:FlgD immunoglobulin-like domain containing protein [candidate division KSB1 bacterium]
MKKLLIVVLMLMFAFSLAYTKDEREMTEIMKAKKQQIEKLKVERKSALKEDTKIEQKGFEIVKSDTRIKLDSPITYSSGKHKFNPVVDQTEGMQTVKESFEGSLPNANWFNYSLSFYNDYHWDVTSCKSINGRKSAWCAESSNWAPDFEPDLTACVDPYPDDMWAVLETIQDIPDNHKSVVIQFWVDLDCEYYWDQLKIYVGQDYWMSSVYLTGTGSGYFEIDVEEYFGPLDPSQAIYISFDFVSDFTNMGVDYFGAFLDDIKIKFHYYDPTVADFEGMPIAGKAPLDVAFINHCGGVPNKFFWSFGDGATLEYQEGWPDWTNPVHTYEESGMFNVGLKAMGNGGGHGLYIPNMIYADADYEYLNMEIAEAGETYPGEGWANAIDHDVHGVASMASAVPEDAWAVVKFEDEAVIQKVRILNNDATAGGNGLITQCLKDFELWTSMDGIDFELVHEGSCEGYKYGKWTEVMLDGLAANYLKIVAKSAQGENAEYIHVYEMQVFGEVAKPCMTVTPDTLRINVGSNNRAMATKVSGVKLDVSKLSDKTIRHAAKQFDAYKTNNVEAEIDTLGNEFTTPYFIWQEQYQVEYEASKIMPATPCSLKTLLIGFWNYEDGTHAKDINFYVWADNGGEPGAELLKLESSIELERSDVFYWISVDVSEANLFFDSPFFIGHEELAAGPPTSLFDTTGTPGTNYWSLDGADWTEEAVDHLQMAVVEYAEGGGGEEATGLLTIANGCKGILNVSDINIENTWVTGVDPVNFSLAMDESQLVTVTVNSEFLNAGQYNGVLHIMSNDPDNPDFKVPVIFTVGGGEAVEGLSDRTNITDARVADEYELHQCYPNPFNPETTIQFELPEVSDVTLSVYNMQGQLISTIVDGQLKSGFHSYTWNATNMAGDAVAGGVYLYKLTASGADESVTLTRKMIFMK